MQPPLELVREPDPYEHRIATHANSWRQFAERHSGMQPNAISQLAIQSACFTLRHRCHDLAIPLRLEAASRHQDELLRMCHQNVAFGTRLGSHSDGMRIEVSHLDDIMGLVPSEHVPWIRPLLPMGADLRLVRLVGCETDNDPLGATIMLTRIGQALVKLQKATSSNARTPVVSEPDSILLWRDPEGTPQSNISSRDRDTVSGHDWGYGGSGPAQLALSILEQFLPEEEAWALHGAFKDQVLDPMPWEGGELTADQVRDWIQREKEERVCC